jgi:hypothetical protein
VSKNGQFFVTITKIIEKNIQNEPIRTTSIPSLWFSVNVTEQGKNIITTYNTTLENGAILNAIVSILYYFLFLFLSLFFFIFLFMSFVFLIPIKVTQFEEVTTPYEFAGTTTTFAQHTLKLNIQIQRWPFLSLSNTLAVLFDAKAANPNPVVCSDPSESLRWILVDVNSVSLYLSRIFFLYFFLFFFFSCWN